MGVDENRETEKGDEPFPVEYWRRRAEIAEATLDNKRKWHLPPERQEFIDLQKELSDARSVIAAQRKDIDVWKQISQRGWDRVTELESEGAAAVLKRERDHWKGTWRNCTRRLANCIEHLGLDHTGVEPNADAE